MPEIAKSFGAKRPIIPPRRGRPPKPGSMRDGLARVRLRRLDDGVWLADWSLDGQRQRRRFPSRAEAQAFARGLLPKLAAAMSEELSAGDAAELRDARAKLERYGRTLPVAVAELAAALDELRRLQARGIAVTLLGAVKQAAAAAREVTETLPLDQLVDRFLADRKSAGSSPKYLEVLGHGLRRLVAGLPPGATELPGRRIQAHLDGLGVAPRSKKNAFMAIAVMVRWAVKRRHLPQSALRELDSVTLPKVRAAALTLPTAEQWREMLAAVAAHRPDLLASLAIMGFSAVRTNEVLRLRWADVREDHVVVGAAQAKTASRRVVPLPDAAQAWLRTVARGQAGDFICPLRHDERLVRAFRRAIASGRGCDWPAVPWVANGLRHAAITHALAVSGDAARVSLNAGNSPQMIVKHYREVSTAAEAEAWFRALPPGQPGNVVQLPRAA